MHTAYVKTPQLKAVIEQNDISCEEKLDQIQKLTEGKKLTLLQPGQSPPTSTTANDQINPPTGNPEHVDKILSEITGVKEKQLAQVILQEIEKSEYISYDVKNWEIIIAGEKIKFTNVIYLIRFIIAANPSSIPVGLALFIHALLKIQVPFEVVRNGDAQNCRDNLIKISEITKSGSEIKQNENGTVENVIENQMDDGGGQNDTGNVEMIKNDVEEAGGVKKLTRKKRNREADDDETVQPAVKRTFALEEKALEGIRRSPRLRQKISEAWTSSDKKKKNGKSSK